ncbi:metallophosphoesterase [Aquisalimonas sp.]|uniref:metallophosphoesterase n=1 Tax=Aquisalimonas sp. TaxID=1872621 RepID=UPI0025BF498A|nr:metallophosphoesterase [Aquisalimonas sp.]
MDAWPGIVRLGRNTAGRDIAVGDLHGMRPLLEKELERIDFDPEVDRLICVGDLVDRGPDSMGSLRLLEEPWFHSVLGNHDFAAAINCMGPAGPVSLDGYMQMRLLPEPWLQKLDGEEKRRLVQLVSGMPVVMEIETKTGAVGIVHAEVPPAFLRWGELVQWIEERCTHDDGLDWVKPLIWGRSFVSLRGARRASVNDASARLPDIGHVIHGHTISIAKGFKPWRLGNRYYIDTGAYLLRKRHQNLLRLLRWPLGGSPRLALVDVQTADQPL